MTVQTRNVYLTVHDAAGIPLENAKVKIRLVGVGNEQGGAVSPESRTAYTDENGYVEFTLWENRQDYSDTHYELSSWHPTKRTAIHARVPFRVFDSDADIVDLISTYLAAAPIDANQALLDQVAADRAACENSATQAIDSLSAVQNIQQTLLDLITTLTSATPLTYYSGTPSIDLNNFVTPARFVINFDSAGIAGHPLEGRDVFYIDPDNTEGAPSNACQGIEIEVTNVPNVSGGVLIYQRATLSNVGTTFVRQKRSNFGSYSNWRVQANSALFADNEKRVLTGSGSTLFSFGYVEFWLEGAHIYYQGFFTLNAASGVEVFNPSNGLFSELSREFVFPLSSANATQTGDPRVVFGQSGQVTVISNATTVAGNHHFQGRARLPDMAT